MDEQELPEILLDRTYLHELAGYYKWVVSLALFVLTTSVGLAVLFPKGLEFEWLLVVGWLLLGLCIFSNWLLIKRLVTLPIIMKTFEEEKGLHHTLFIRTMPLLKKYGCIQNWAFLLGVGFVGGGFLLNVLL